jgi:hypothetical protein
MGVIVVKFTDAIARVLKRVKIGAGGGGDFWSGHYRPVCRLSSRCWEQGSYLAELWWPRPWDRGCLEHPTATAVVWLPAPTVSRIEGGRRTRNMAILFHITFAVNAVNDTYGTWTLLKVV